MSAPAEHYVIYDAQGFPQGVGLTADAAYRRRQALERDEPHHAPYTMRRVTVTPSAPIIKPQSAGYTTAVQVVL